MASQRLRGKRNSDTEIAALDVEACYGIKQLLMLVGENPSREGLQETPKRFVKAFKEMTEGYAIDPKSVLKTFSSEGYDQMIVLRDIPAVSTCEHHLAAFQIIVDIGYLPNKKIIGLSKLARLVEIFSRRLQVQERLTDQIASTLYEVLKPQGVGCRIRGTHSCMTNRGIKKTGIMETTSLKGNFLKPEVKSEFLQL